MITVTVLPWGGGRTAATSSDRQSPRRAQARPPAILNCWGRHMSPSSRVSRDNSTLVDLRLPAFLTTSDVTDGTRPSTNYLPLMNDQVVSHGTRDTDYQVATTIPSTRSAPAHTIYAAFDGGSRRDSSTSASGWCAWDSIAMRGGENYAVRGWQK
jgi:hypothetical protein